MNDVKEIREALEHTIVEADGVVYQSKHRGDQALIVAAAWAYVELLESNALIIQRDLDPEFGEEWVWPEAVVHAIGKALYGWADGEPNEATGYIARAEVGVVLTALDALAAVVPVEANDE